MESNTLIQLLGQWSNGAGPLYRQLADALERQVLSGALRAGDRLPAERSLAETLAVSRGTVVRAFELLEQKEILERVQGRGTTVTGNLLATSPNPGFVGDALWRPEDDSIDLLRAIPRLLPSTRQLISEIDLTAYADDLNGSEPLGWWSLRAAIAKLHSAQGLPTSPHQVLVTNGAQQAISLVVNSMVQPGDVVLGEDDTWPGLVDSVRHRRARFEPVPMDSEGIILADLEAKVERCRPTLIALNPQHQNPTGSRLPLDRVKAVAEIARRHRVLVLEDRVAADLGFDRRHLPAIDEFNTGGYGITISSIGKVAWPGVRLGWMRADAQIINRMRSHKAVNDMFTPALSQILGINIIERYDDFVAERVAGLHSSAEVVIGHLERNLPDWSFLPPRGGYSIWATLPDNVSADAFVRAVGRNGLLLASGRAFCPNDADCSNIRIPFTEEPHVLEAAMERLAETWTTFRDHEAA